MYICCAFVGLDNKIRNLFNIKQDVDAGYKLSAERDVYDPKFRF